MVFVSVVAIASDCFIYNNNELFTIDRRDRLNTNSLRWGDYVYLGAGSTSNDSPLSTTLYK